MRRKRNYSKAEKQNSRGEERTGVLGGEKD